MKKKVTIELIEDKLFDLTQAYGKIKENFDNLEREYILLKAQIYTRPEVAGLGSQHMRDAQCEIYSQETETGKNFLELKTKMDIINMNIRLWTAIARVHTSWNQ